MTSMTATLTLIGGILLRAAALTAPGVAVAETSFGGEDPLGAGLTAIFVTILVAGTGGFHDGWRHGLAGSALRWVPATITYAVSDQVWAQLFATEPEWSTVAVVTTTLCVLALVGLSTTMAHFLRQGFMDWRSTRSVPSPSK